MNRKTILLVLILFPLLSCAEDFQTPDAYLKYDDFYLYLGQNVEEVRQQFGQGVIKEIDDSNGLYIQETFADGTTISYYQKSEEVLYISTLNEKAESPLGIRINDSKEKIFSKSENIYDQGILVTYLIPLKPVHSADPLGASVIYVLDDDLVSEIHVNYQTD